MMRSVPAVFVFLIQDVETERTLRHITPFHARIQVHSFGIVRIDTDASPESAFVLTKLKRAGGRPPENESRIMVNQCPYIRVQFVGERPRSDGLSAAMKYLVVAIKNSEISLDAGIFAIFSRIEI